MRVYGFVAEVRAQRLEIMESGSRRSDARRQNEAEAKA